MKSIRYILATSTIAAALLVGCSSPTPTEDAHAHDHGGHEDEVHFNMAQFDAMEMEVGVPTMQNISAYVEANGTLEVPPGHEAAVTAMIGANVMSIEVIEGDAVKKGQVLATVSHPSLIQLQSDYIQFWNELEYKAQNYERQQKLYDEKVGSGKEFQKVKADYLSTKGKVQGLAAQIHLLGLSTETLKQGEIAEVLGIRSPIDGFVRMVEIKTGQYVAPETELFEIVNIEHIHADFMVFEKDIAKVREGQKVRFESTAFPGETYEAEIYSVGKNFEKDPKAVHLHAEIENKTERLLPGMYVHGKIMTSDEEVKAIPEAALIVEGDRAFVFSAEEEVDHGERVWAFKPIEVKVGETGGGWVEVSMLSPTNANAQFALNNAYYLMAELKKAEAEHTH